MRFVLFNPEEHEGLGVSLGVRLYLRRSSGSR